MVRMGNPSIGRAFIAFSRGKGRTKQDLAAGAREEAPPVSMAKARPRGDSSS